MPELSPEVKKRNFKKEYFSARTDVGELLTQGMRILKHHLACHEKDITEGMGYKKLWDRGKARDAMQLSDAIRKIEAQYIEHEKRAKQKIENMSKEEEVTYLLGIVDTLPPGYKAMFFNGLVEKFNLQPIKRRYSKANVTT